LVKTREHLGFWDRTPSGVNEEYRALEREEQEIRRAKEWHDEVNERMKLYKQDERWVRLEHEIEQLRVELVAAGYFPYSGTIKDKLKEASLRLDELEKEIEKKLLGL